MPAAWTEPELPGALALAPDWWRNFGSAELSALIAAAQRSSPDMAIAEERVRQAEAQARIAGASLFPELNFGAATSRREVRPDGGDWTRSDASSGRVQRQLRNRPLGAQRRGPALGRGLAAGEPLRPRNRAPDLLSGIAGGYFQVLSLRGVSR